jgi:hypothetical protein
VKNHESNYLACLIFFDRFHCFLYRTACSKVSHYLSEYDTRTTELKKKGWHSKRYGIEAEAAIKKFKMQNLFKHFSF